MGRLETQGKLDCETCHGPGSVHVRDVGCASCHGDRGISRWAGIPSLVGQEPQYLVTATRVYVTGERKNFLMKALLKGLTEREFESIALYYARQIPARAQTPLVGNPATGRKEIAGCVACHGADGVSASPDWPNLAGQDARFLAYSMRAFRKVDLS